MNGWYYKLFDSDFGPVSFDELVDLAKNNTLSRDDQVRFGENGPWRQAGSIGPLMAHFPFQAVEKVVSVSTLTPMSESWVINEAESVPSLDDFVISESSEARATPRPAHRAIYEPTPVPQVATPQPVKKVPKKAASTSGPKTPAAAQPTTDSRWWCMIQDKEYGPVDLPKLIEWASTGRLHRDDYVRYGLDPYARADSIPQLFPKLPNQPEEQEEEKKELAPQDLMDFLTVGSGAPATAKKRETAPAVAVAAAPVTPAPQPVAPPPAPVTSAGFGAAGSSSLSSSMSAGLHGGGMSGSRPVMPVRPMPSRSSSSSGGIGAILGSPAVLGGVGAVVLGALLFLAGGYLGLFQSADAGRVKELDTLMTELTKARASKEYKASDAKAIASKIETAAKRIASELKDTKDKKSKKVLALANKLEEVAKLDLSKPSDEEKKANDAISAAKVSLTSARKAYQN